MAVSAAVLAAFSAPAFGALNHPLKATFGNVANPADLAIDKTTGNVFVADTGASATSVQIFSPGGGPPIGVEPGPIEGFDFSQRRTALAVDNSAGSPSLGALYVADRGHQIIKKFLLNPVSKEYEQVGSLPSPAFPDSSETTGIAVDASGNVFVSEYVNQSGHFDGALIKFSPTGVELGRAQFNASSPTLKSGVRGLAFDSQGNLYGGGLFDVGIWKFPVNGSGEVDLGASPIRFLVDDGEVQDIAIDPTDDSLYSSFGDHVGEYSLACLPGCGIEREFGSGVLQKGGVSTTGIAVSPSNGDIYVGSGGTHNVALFGAALAVLPDVTTDATTEVTSDAATINGTVSAAGGPDVTCQFEYIGKADFEAGGFSGASVAPCTPSGPFTGSATETVEASLGGLAVNAPYVYRLRASSVNGPGFGRALDFSTVGKPLVAVPAIAQLDTETATVEGFVNPNGGPGASQGTTYFLEYVSSENFALNGFAGAIKVPAGGKEIGSGVAGIKVTQQLSGLAASVSYHLRFVAQNEAGETVGPEAVFSTYPVSPVFSGCGNENLRGALGSSSLPDCRGYEQVSPVAKNGAAPTIIPLRYQATSDGEGISYLSHGGFPGTEGGQGFPSFFASRGSGWASRGVLPPSALGAAAGVLGWSADLSRAYIALGAQSGKPVSLLERDSASGELQTITAPERSTSLATAFYYVGGSHDGSLVFFEAEDKPGVFNSYVWNRLTGEIRIAGALSGGAAPVKGTLAGTNNIGLGGRGQALQATHTVSEDGSQLFFTDAAATGQLYVRRNAAAEVEGCADATAACTIQISKSKRAPLDPNGVKKPRFWEATPDGSKVFFTSPSQLTNDATTGPNDEGNDLYRYDVGSGELLDLVPDPGDPAGADVQGVLGASVDGSHVYFVANGALTSGSAPGSCKPPTEESGGSGSCSLYLWNEGAIAFIARLVLDGNPTLSDSNNWSTAVVGRPGAGKSSRLTADGQILLFRSAAKLTTYDNRSTPELYRFTASDGETLCVSCNPTGVPPLAGAILGSTLQSVPSGLGNVPPAAVLSRNLSSDGKRVFFETPDKLVAADTNGDQSCTALSDNVYRCQDVYEWEARGTGSCQSDSANGGCLYLVSDGRSGEPAFFADADDSGANAFFLTDRSLVGQDQDKIRDLYDARVGGGLAYQAPPVATPPCEGDACKGKSSSAPGSQAAGTESFSESPAKPTCGRGKVKKHGRCVKKPGRHQRKHRGKKGKHPKGMRHSKKHGVGQ